MLKLCTIGVQGGELKTAKIFDRIFPQRTFICLGRPERRICFLKTELNCCCYLPGIICPREEKEETSGFLQSASVCNQYTLFKIRKHCNLLYLTGGQSVLKNIQVRLWGQVHQNKCIYFLLAHLALSNINWHFNCLIWTFGEPLALISQMLSVGIMEKSLFLYLIRKWSVWNAFLILTF